MYQIEIKKNDNPLLNEVNITNDNLNFHCSIYPNLGASLQKLSSDGVDIIDGITNNEDGLNTYNNNYNSSFLFPFPSRIPEGKYVFNNQEYVLECNEVALNNALHGHIYNKNFTIKHTETTKNSIAITFSYLDDGSTKGFPFPYQIEIKYTFSQDKLNIEFNVYNKGETAFPFGIGWHPYFKTKNLSESILDFEAENQYLLNDKMIPEREIPLKYNTPLRINNTFLDDCFITKKSNASFKTNEYTIDLDFSSKSPNSFLQVYTPKKRESIAIEPMTCSGNCFNNKNGLLVLEPNNKFEWSIHLNLSKS